MKASTAMLLEVAVTLALVLGVCLPVAAQAPDVAEVDSFEALKAVKPIRLDNGWEVRLGLSGGGKDAGPWKLLYCLARYTGELKDGKVGFSVVKFKAEPLGPVSYTVDYMMGKDRRLAGILEAILRQKEWLYCRAVPVAWKGDCWIRVYDHHAKLIAMKRITVKDPLPCYWQTFATDTEKREEGKPWYRVSRQTTAATPQYNGALPVWPPSVQTEIITDGKMPLPGVIAMDSPWNRNYIRKNRKSGPMGEPIQQPLRLALEKGAFVIRSDVKLPAWPDLHLLARWWVNGKPVIAPRSDEMIKHPQGRTLSLRREMRVTFGVPVSLGPLKPGARVALQVLYTPVEYQQVWKTRDRERPLSSTIGVPDFVTVPLLSNRLEFVVTKGMVDEERNLEAHVRLFLVESSKEKSLFPWKLTSPAVEKIAPLGPAVLPYLKRELRDLKPYYEGKHFDFTVQQNITMAFCRVAGVKLVLGKTVYSIRSTRKENGRVFRFWKQFVVTEEMLGPK